MSKTHSYCINPCECSGCQACIEMCPELFGWDDNNAQVVLLEESADEERIAEAMAYCPNDCIEMVESRAVCRAKA